jgi:hypothetical protein
MLNFIIQPLFNQVSLNYLLWILKLTLTSSLSAMGTLIISTWKITLIVQACTPSIRTNYLQAARQESKPHYCHASETYGENRSNNDGGGAYFFGSTNADMTYERL